jgi:hypothetical protein
MSYKYTIDFVICYAGDSKSWLTGYFSGSVASANRFQV